MIMLLQLFLFFFLFADENLAINNGNGKRRYIVCPQVKTAAGLDIKPSVVPVASQHAIFGCSPVQWKPHVGTTVVKRINPAINLQDKNIPAFCCNYKTTFLLQLL